MTNDKARREMEALFPGHEKNDALRAAFLAHPDADHYLRLMPDLGCRIPGLWWRMVLRRSGVRVSWLGTLECGRLGSLRTHRPVCSVSDRRQWVPDLPGGERQLVLIGTVPGSTRHPDRPDAVTLLGHVAELTAAWHADAETTRVWHTWALLHNQPPFPQTYAEIAFDGDVLRGLVVGGRFWRTGHGTSGRSLT